MSIEKQQWVRVYRFLTLSLIILNRPVTFGSSLLIDAATMTLTYPDCASGAADMGFGFAWRRLGWIIFPLLLMGMRFLIAATVLVWFVPVPHGYLRQICGISFIAATLQYGLTFSGLAQATPAVLLVQAEVVFGVIIAALLLGEKPSMGQVVGIAVSCFGILTIVGAPSLEGQILV